MLVIQLLKTSLYLILLGTWLGSMTTICRAQRIVLTDVTNQTGITFVHTDGSFGKRYMMENVTAGLALFDYDRDGDIDIYFLNGGIMKGNPSKEKPANALYRNDGDWKFTDVTAAAAVGDTGHGLGVAVGDYDNDGDLDIYLNNHGPNVLYRNNGDGTFSDVTKQAKVSNGDQMGAGTCFLDADKDGNLDLYVSNYVVFDYKAHVIKTRKGHPYYTGPPNYPTTVDVMYRNNGNGTFTDVTVESGIAGASGSGMGMVCADYDNDGDTDIFVANDMGPNFLWQNDGQGKFEEMGLISGFAYDLHGEEYGSMGPDCGDYDNDGLLDIYLTSYSKQLATLYRNLGDGFFEDVSRTTGAATSTFPCVTWGNGFVDFDNDGDRDIFVAAGHLQDNVELWDDTARYMVPNILLMNTGDGKFVDISKEAGSGMKVVLSSRGAGFDDLDNDGDVDVAILNSRREPTILRNDSPSKGHWLAVSLRGVKTNRDGVGARVKVVAGDLSLIDEVHSGRSYQSHFGMRLHFGLGEKTKVDRIEVSWIGGGLDVIENIDVDQFVTLTEGSSRIQSK